MKENSNSLDITKIFPFELDEFQLKAIAALDAGKSVVVCAPTGSGKTLIGEYAIYRALASGKRVFYTTPLKALSNQKFRDFQEIFSTKHPLGEYVVGLITGDVLINPEAPIVVMTTEIFRNMLYETPIGQVGTSLENIETVVLDECHYISDTQRGTVWEESIIYCPGKIQLVALSATIGNPEELTEWINHVRISAQKKDGSQDSIKLCELINSDFRPVPLRFYFSNKNGLVALLNGKQNKINPKLLQGKKNGKRRFKREDCPSISEIVNQLQEKDMLPAIYVIFSRKGCEQAVKELGRLTLVNYQETEEIKLKILQFFFNDNINLQKKLVTYFSKDKNAEAKLISYFAENREITQELLDLLENNANTQGRIWQFLTENPEIARYEYLEPLTRGIATHHAGLLPSWKELVEKLFELGLVKVVFATATLAAGINMPARTTVISSLSKRTDDGHSFLTPSEFLQIAGRAGRRGKDKLGHVVTVQTPFEGAEYAAYLATAEAEPLKSCFTPSYGMVLNLLQKHTVEEAKDLLERSFAEYLAQLKLEPKQKEIADLSTELTKLDLELAAIEVEVFYSYEKLRERLKEEYRLLEILKQQAEMNRKKDIFPKLANLKVGNILSLKGKHLQVSSPINAVLVSFVVGSGKAPDLLCLGADNRWYWVTNTDVVDINEGTLPKEEIEKLPLPNIESISLGRPRKGDEITAIVSNRIFESAFPLPVSSEVIEQQKVVVRVETELDNHPLQKFPNPGQLVKRHHQRIRVREQLHTSQKKYQQTKAKEPYYWEEFLNLIEILREFQALEGFTPTPLGEIAATIRGENELWLGLALSSGDLDFLEPPQLAAAVSALITETPRPDSWTNYPHSQVVLEALGFKRPDQGTKVTLREKRRQLNQLQTRYDIGIPVWLEAKFIGLVEQWALGVDWNELCSHTSLDEGDIIRLLRRTLDILWQIPQIPRISPILESKAKTAIALMKRFPL